jgi:dolichyl-phosphate-mannose--protein O-mannosyl transferase
MQEASLKKEEEESSDYSDSVVDDDDDDDDVQTVKMALQESSRDQFLITPHQTVLEIQMT